MYLPPYLNVFLLILAVWSIVWKIYAVWFAAKHNQKKWFLAMIILNTAGILEIFYVFKILKKRWVEVKEDFRGAWKSFK
jgi:predicted membrane channel-forming protein YqfA (hemolysin III family)